MRPHPAHRMEPPSRTAADVLVDLAETRRQTARAAYVLTATRRGIAPLLGYPTVAPRPATGTGLFALLALSAVLWMLV